MNRNHPHSTKGLPGDVPGEDRGVAQTSMIRSVLATATLFAVVLAILSAAPAAAAEAVNCDGRWVRTLGGPHAVTRIPIDDVAGLRHSLPALEASIRAVVTRDASLGPVVADALIAAIRDGSGISERVMKRDEAVRWMAYQPAPGRFEAIAPACLKLTRSYDAFEITVEIPEPAPTGQTPVCAVLATRDCALQDPKITVDLRGSSPGARATMSVGGQPAVAIGGGQGERFSIDDPGQYERAAVFTVRAEGAPVTTRTARVFRFLMPKICGNLAYLGEAPSRTIAAASAALTCEKSVSVGVCTPVVVPPPVEPEIVADVCEEGWVTRPFLFAFMPLGDKQSRDILLGSRPARETFEMDGGYGVGLAMEKRMGPVLGLEAAAMFGRGDSEYDLDDGVSSGSDSHPTNFYALTFGPNFHLLGCGGTDLYVGPFLGYGGFADPNYWALDHHFRADFDGRFVWGAQLGLDLPFKGDGPWGLHGGVRYMRLSQDTDAGSIKVDPLIVELGLSYRH